MSFTCPEQNDLVLQGEVREVGHALGPLDQREELLVGCVADVGDGVIGLRKDKVVRAGPGALRCLLLLPRPRTGTGGRPAVPSSPCSGPRRTPSWAPPRARPPGSSPPACPRGHHPHSRPHPRPSPGSVAALPAQLVNSRTRGVTAPPRTARSRGPCRSQLPCVKQGWSCP